MASEPLILALTRGLRPVMVTGSCAIWLSLQPATARAGEPETPTSSSATSTCRTRALPLRSAPAALRGRSRPTQHPAALPQRIDADPDPDDVHRRRGQGAIPAAVNHEACPPQNVHEVIAQGA